MVFDATRYYRLTVWGLAEIPLCAVSPQTQAIARDFSKDAEAILCLHLNERGDDEKKIS